MASGVAAARSASTEKRSDFVAIAAYGHGAPAAAVSTGIVVEEQTAGGVRAAADGGAGAFDKKFCGGTSESREEPIEATFAGDKLQGPGTIV